MRAKNYHTLKTAEDGHKTHCVWKKINGFTFFLNYFSLTFLQFYFCKIKLFHHLLGNEIENVLPFALLQAFMDLGLQHVYVIHQLIN